MSGTSESDKQVGRHKTGSKKTGGGRRKRHHYLPQGYLRLWADDRGQLAVRQRASSTSFIASTARVAVKSDLYSVLSDDGAGGTVYDDTLETELSRLESDLPALLTGLRENGPPKRKSDLRVEVARHVALQMSRTREHVEQWYFANAAAAFTGQGPVIEREAMRRFLTEAYLGDEPEDVEVQGACDFAYVMLSNGLPSKAQMLELQLNVSSTHLTESLAKKAWAVEHCPTAAFWTCDRPVALWRKDPLEYSYQGVGVDNANEVRFPLGPHHLLVMRPKFPEGPFVVAPARVESVNYSMAAQCHLDVIGSPSQRVALDALTLRKVRPALRFAHGPVARPMTGPDGRTVDVKTGEEIMHQYVAYGDEALG